MGTGIQWGTKGGGRLWSSSGMGGGLSRMEMPADEDREEEPACLAGRMGEGWGQ